MFKFLLITLFTFSAAQEGYRLKIINSKNAELTASLQKKLTDVWNSISNNDKNSYINFDEAEDVVWIYGKISDIKSFKSLFKKLDKKPAQVRIDFVIMRANDIFNENFAFNWTGIYNRISKITNFNFVGLGATLTDIPTPTEFKDSYMPLLPNITTFLPNLNPPQLREFLITKDFIPSNITFPVFFVGPNINTERLAPILNAYKSTEKVQLYSYPSVLADDGNTTKFFIGQIFPYYTSIQDSVYDNPDQTILTTLNVSQLNYKNIGTMIQIEPTIISHNKISMHLFIERNSIYSGSNLYSINQVMPDPPVLRSIKFEERIILEDGRTIVILTSTNKNDYSVINRAPKLSRIPIIGKFFRGSAEFENLEKEFIIITAKIID